ncbi:recombinase family protein [Enterococcus faecalis]
MAKIGYARVSSTDQNLDRQLELLSNWGPERLRGICIDKK